MHAASPTVITGIGVSPGRVVAPAVLMPDPIAEPPSGRRLPPGTDYAAEAKRIGAASEVVRAALDAAADRAQGESADLLHATAAIAADPTLVADAEQRVVDDRLVPERAVWEAAEAVAEQFEALGGYFAERTRDIADVRDRLVAELTGRPAPGRARARGAVRAGRGRPGARDRRDARHRAGARDRHRDRRAHVAHRDPRARPRHPDGRRGPRCRGGRAGRGPRARRRLGRDGDRRPHGRAGRGRAARSPRRSARSTGTGAPPTGTTSSCWRTWATPSDAAPAAAAGAEGVGLFRTEFGFLDRDEAPTIDEQVAAYRRVLAAFPGRKVVVRTLDAGADKPLPFLAGDAEVNPALGVRGLRTAARHPEVLDDQLTAIARAAAAETAEVWVMAPMVSTVDEAEQFVAACAAHGLPTSPA